MAEKKKLLYVQTSGVDTPKRLYSPFVLGMTAKAMDIDATIYFLGLGLTVVKKGIAETVKEGDFPSLKEIMDQAINAGVELLICEQSTQLLNMERGTSYRKPRLWEPLHSMTWFWMPMARCGSRMNLNSIRPPCSLLSIERGSLGVAEFFVI
jgi:uncharacterized protein